MTGLGWEEIQKHNSKDDTWIVLHGIVYNVTKYLDNHPGGGDLLLEVAGQDATSFFEAALHSEEARDILPRLKVGSVEEYRRSDEASDSILIVGAQAVEKRASRASTIILVTLSLVVAPLLGYHGDKLYSLCTVSAQQIAAVNPLWISAVAIMMLSVGVLCTWASYVIYVDYGDLQKFPARVRID